MKLNKANYLLVFLILLITACSTEVNLNAINGLQPVDVYLNLEKEGFTTTKNFTTEYGNSWVNDKATENMKFNVSTFSNDVSSVERVTATVMISYPKKIESTKQFLKYISSLPYENANPQQAAQWIEKHFYKDKDSIIIGDAKLTIYCPSNFVRMLSIEKGKRSEKQ